jgi:formate-dependent nitrite reductase membrane component NrfD
MSRRAREEPAFSSYYGRPILKEPTWEPVDIAGYLFLGGLAGASSILAAGADTTGRPTLSRSAKLGALISIGLSAAALVHDLGRPKRFVNMLRVAKPTSPMSVGSWLLAMYGPLVGAAAASDLLGALPRAGRAAAAGAAVLGSGVASYTSVLLADTAVPAWHEVRRELPFVFVGSAAAAAGGLGMVTVPISEAGPARRTAIGGAMLELGAGAAMESRAGLVGETFRQGTPGSLVKASRVMTGFGAVAATIGGRSRAVSTAAGLSLLAGSALTRFGIFAAGQASTRDPKYTVLPQRAELAAGAGILRGGVGHPGKSFD